MVVRKWGPHQRRLGGRYEMWAPAWTVVGHQDVRHFAQGRYIPSLKRPQLGGLVTGLRGARDLPDYKWGPVKHCGVCWALTGGY